MKTNIENRTWIAFANRNKCRHADAIRELNFINWVMGRAKFTIGDTIYLFMSDERRIRFKMVVSKENCKREDQEYWETEVPNDITYKLEIVTEYHGEKLNESELKKHGFSGGKSIEQPMCNNKELFEYIKSIL